MEEWRSCLIWAWYANRIGVNSFLELYFEQKSSMRECRMRSPAAAFHSRLKRFYAAYFGATDVAARGLTLCEFVARRVPFGAATQPCNERNAKKQRLDVPDLANPPAAGHA